MSLRRECCRPLRSACLLCLVSVPAVAFLSHPGHYLALPRDTPSARTAGVAALSSASTLSTGGPVDPPTLPSTPDAPADVAVAGVGPLSIGSEGPDGTPRAVVSTAVANFTLAGSSTEISSTASPSKGELPTPPRNAAIGDGDESAVDASQRTIPASDEGSADSATAVKGASNHGAESASMGIAARDGGASEAPTTMAEPATEGVLNLRRKPKAEVAADPDTAAAEKVLRLWELGLVDKEEVAAYYDALSNLERSTRAAKEVARSPSLRPPSRASRLEPLAGLAPFPVLCAALGAAGMHSLYLPGALDVAVSICGAVAGAGVGGLVVAREDAMGGAARAVGSVVASSASAAGGAAGRAVSSTVESAAVSVVVAAEEAVMRAPAEAANSLARSVSESMSAGVSSVAAVPGDLAAKAANGAKAVLVETSKSAARIPGEVAKSAASAVGDALRTSPKAAMRSAQLSQTGASSRDKQAVTIPPKSLSATVSSTLTSVSKTGTEKISHARKADALSMATSPAASESERAQTSTPSLIDDSKAGAIPLEELEAKMKSVQKALERFDAVKDRIEVAQTSGTLRDTIVMTRGVEVAPEKTSDGVTRKQAGPVGAGAGEEREGSGRLRPSPSSPTSPQVEGIDEGKRKQVAEQLLEKATRRATKAKVGLKAAAVSERKEADSNRGDPTRANAEGAAPARPAAVATASL